MLETLKKIAARPEPFEFYTADKLWTDPHISKRMLEYHLDETVDLASRKPEFIVRSVDWLTSRFTIDQNTRIGDFGCGPGLYTTRLAQLGVNVTGIDFSERSIDYARETAQRLDLDIDYVCTDYLEYQTDRSFDLILMIFCDYCALSPGQRTLMLEKFRRLLADGGSIVLDVVSMKHFESAGETRSFKYVHSGGFWAPRPHFVFESHFKYDDEGLLLDKYVIVDSSGRREIYNWIQCFTPESLADEVARHSLKVVDNFGNVAGDAFDPDSAQFAATLQAE